MRNRALLIVKQECTVFRPPYRSLTPENGSTALAVSGLMNKHVGGELGIV